VDRLSVKTVARDINFLFQSCHPFVVFEIIQNNVWLSINTRDEYILYMGKMNYVVVISKELPLVKFIVSVSVYFVYEGKVTLPPTGIIGEVVKEKIEDK
jgi:hypothetical protein